MALYKWWWLLLLYVEQTFHKLFCPADIMQRVRQHWKSGVCLFKSKALNGDMTIIMNLLICSHSWISKKQYISRFKTYKAGVFFKHAHITSHYVFDCECRVLRGCLRIWYSPVSFWRGEYLAADLCEICFSVLSLDCVASV